MPQDDCEAARFFRLTAVQGNSSARFNLWECYFDGRGVQQDLREAVCLYRLVADQGVCRAQLSLGDLLITGNGEPAVPRQLKEGVRLLARAAQQTDKSEQVEALAAPKCLSAHAHERDVVHACCIGCGKTKDLKLCGKCRVAKWCGRECAKRMWPVHKVCCKQWAGAPSVPQAALNAE